MNDHYFTKNPTSEFGTKEIIVNIFGAEYNFITGRGVFAFDKFDRGTELLIKSISGKGKFLDLGCGYGAVGIIIANSFGKVVQIDINERAIILAKRNAKLNRRKNCKAIQSDGFEAVKDQKFDVIATNPPNHAGKKLIISWIAQVKDYLEKDGEFYFVCKTKLGAKSYESEILEKFGNCDTVKKGSGYRVYRAVNS
jgi:16S rRNA (guanine1207-N2)-methyltransferase